jgi:sec-independent protein translocase protein TatA
MFLLLFGAKRIPEIGRSLGKGIREFKGSLAGLDEPIAGRAVGEGAPLVYDPTITAAESTVTMSVRDVEPIRRLNG